MDIEFMNMVRRLMADTVEMSAVDLQPNKFMNEDDILEHQRKCTDLAKRIREDIK